MSLNDDEKVLSEGFVADVNTGFFVDQNLEQFELILIQLRANSFDSFGLLTHVGGIGCE